MTPQDKSIQCAFFNAKKVKRRFLRERKNS
jgi:hypothetical protein